MQSCCGEQPHCDQKVPKQTKSRGAYCNPRTCAVTAAQGRRAYAHAEGPGRTLGPPAAATGTGDRVFRASLLGSSTDDGDRCMNGAVEPDNEEEAVGVQALTGVSGEDAATGSPRRRRLSSAKLWEADR
jgi:hypothetical protein